MRRKLSKKTLRYKLAHNSAAALIVATLRKLKKRNDKVELEHKYHYERLMKEFDPRPSFIGEALAQISRDRGIERIRVK